MSDITGGELLARALQAEGIEYLFGLPSPESDPLLAVLVDHGFRVVPVRHEAAAVHMAEGLYKTTGKVAAVLGNPGPGTANLVPGLLTALHEGVPVVAITSQHRLGLVYPSTPATFQGQGQLDLLRPVVKWGGPILGRWNWASSAMCAMPSKGLLNASRRERFRASPMTLPVTGPSTSNNSSNRRGRSSTGKARGSIRRWHSASSERSSVPTPSTPWTAAAPLCGPMQCYRQRSPARTTRFSSSACSVPASPPRSAPSLSLIHI